MGVLAVIAKFGLTIPEIIEAVDQLRSANLLELQLLHFHIALKFPQLTWSKMIREASQIYVELAQLERI